MALNDTYFFQAHGTLAGQVYIHTLHFREFGSPIVGDPAQSCINAWQAACQTLWLNAHPTTYTLERLTCQRICGSLPLPVPVEESVALPGVRMVGSTGELLAPWLALLVTERTALAGKSYRGRFFMSGGGESDISGTTISNGSLQWGDVAQQYVTALTNEFVNPVAPDLWQLVVHSRKLAAIPGTDCTDSSTPVTTLSRSLTLTSMRSRRA